MVRKIVRKSERTEVWGSRAKQQTEGLIRVCGEINDFPIQRDAVWNDEGLELDGALPLVLAIGHLLLQCKHVQSMILSRRAGLASECDSLSV